MELKEAEGEWEAVEFIRKLSPVAVQHIILKGRFEFGQKSEKIDMKKMMSVLNEALKKQKKS